MIWCRQKSNNGFTLEKFIVFPPRMYVLECNLCTSFALFTSLNINVLHLIIVIYLCFTFVGAILLIDDKIEL